VIIATNFIINWGGRWENSNDTVLGMADSINKSTTHPLLIIYKKRPTLDEISSRVVRSTFPDAEIITQERPSDNTVLIRTLEEHFNTAMTVRQKSSTPPTTSIGHFQERFNHVKFDSHREDREALVQDQVALRTLLQELSKLPSHNTFGQERHLEDRVNEALDKIAQMQTLLGTDEEYDTAMTADANDKKIINTVMVWYYPGVHNSDIVELMMRLIVQLPGIEMGTKAGSLEAHLPENMRFIYQLDQRTREFIPIPKESWNELRGYKPAVYSFAVGPRRYDLILAPGHKPILMRVDSTIVTLTQAFNDEMPKFIKQSGGLTGLNRDQMIDVFAAAFYTWYLKHGFKGPRKKFVKIMSDQTKKWSEEDQLAVVIDGKLARPSQENEEVGVIVMDKARKLWKWKEVQSDQMLNILTMIKRDMNSRNSAMKAVPQLSTGEKSDEQVNQQPIKDERLESQPAGEYSTEYTPQGSQEFPSGDSAMRTPGGIDLNSANMAMTITKDVNGGVKVNFDPAMIAQIRQKGVYSAIPVIISVTTMSQAQLRPLLDLPQ